MSATATARRQVVLFALGDELFAADVFGVERVLRYRAPTVVPQLPPWVVGLLDHGGRALPLLDLRARLSLPPAAAEVDRRVLVVGADGLRLGVVVDRVLEVVAVPPDCWEEPPAVMRGLARAYLQGVLRRDDRLVMILDPARLLSATERLALERAVS